MQRNVCWSRRVLVAARPMTLLLGCVCRRLCGLGQKERDDALNEVKCLSKIQHAYVTRYHESLFDKGFLNIIMEYAPNGDLAARIRAQRSPHPVPFADAVVMKWFLQLLVALDFIHEEACIYPYRAIA